GQTGSVLNGKLFEHECGLGVCNSPPWSRRGSRSRRRRRGSLFKVAQHPYGFPRSAPNSKRYFRYLIQPPRQTPAAQSPRLVQGGEFTDTQTRSPFVTATGTCVPPASPAFWQSYLGQGLVIDLQLPIR